MTKAKLCMNEGTYKWSWDGKRMNGEAQEWPTRHTSSTVATSSFAVGFPLSLRGTTSEHSSFLDNLQHHATIADTEEIIETRARQMNDP